MNKTLPPELQQLADTLKNHPHPEIIYRAYDIVSQHFTSSRHLTYLRFWDLFRKDLTKVWNQGGFCHCTQQNELIRQTVLATGKFSKKQIHTKWGLAHYVSPHQWLQVNIDGTWTDVDPWGRSFGVPFGKNASGFTASWHRTPAQWQERNLRRTLEP